MKEKFANDNSWQEEDLFRIVLDTVKDAIASWDEKGIIRSWNKTAEIVFGWTAEEIINRSADILIPDRFKKKVKEAVTRVDKEQKMTKEGTPFEVVGLHKNGTEIPLEVTMNRVTKGSHVLYTAVWRDVKERKKRQQELFNTILRYDELTEISRSFIWEVNIEGLYTYISPVITKIIGYHPAEIIGEKYFHDMVPEEDREEIKMFLIDRLTNKDEINNFENRLKCRNGEVLWVLSNGRPILDNNNNVIGYRGVDEDITKLKQFQQVLAQSEERYRTFLKAIPDMMFILSKEGKYLDYHAPKTDHFLVSPAKIIGENLENVVTDKQTYKKMMNAIAEAIATQQLVIMEYDLHLPQGRLYFEARIIALEKEKVLGIVRDITQRKRIEKELQENRDQYHSLVINNPGVVFRCRFDNDWTMMFLSHNIEKLCGYPYQDFIENKIRSYESIIHPEDRDYVVNNIKVAVEKNRSWEIEYRIKTKDDSIRWVFEKGRAVYSTKDQSCFLDGLIIDTTERKMMEDKIKKTNQELIDAYQKLKDAQDALIKSEQKNAVLATVVTTNHEINQPLTVLAGNLQLLEHKLKNPDNEKYFQRMHQSLNRIEQTLAKLKEVDKVNLKSYVKEIEMLNIDKEQE